MKMRCNLKGFYCTSTGRRTTKTTTTPLHTWSGCRGCKRSEKPGREKENFFPPEFPSQACSTPLFFRVTLPLGRQMIDGYTTKTTKAAAAAAVF